MIDEIPIPDFGFSDDDLVISFDSILAASPPLSHLTEVDEAINYFGFHMDYDQNPLKSTSNSIVYKISTTFSNDEGTPLYAMKATMKKYRIKQEFEKYFKYIMESPFFVKTYDMFEYNNIILMQMELCEGGDIYSKKLAERDIWQIINNIGQALHLLHTDGVIHLDVSPSNILKGDNLYKLSDFGTICEMADFIEGMEGAGPYVAPEILNFIPGQKITGKADIFSFGLVLLEAATGYFAPRGGDINYSKIRKGEIFIGSRLYDSDGVSQELVNVINSMIRPDPIERPSAYDLVIESCRIARMRQYV
ncbi:CAMK family protein kinase [Tritrichomonas foetus]|uniref:non-specific serine/threonine protein kinase n=1 Tax=Tritrichomonas foetus TaxID=1144522 RepID=A0A1J4JBK7_9EUKA|nr:CAMK family protein kinase [Tritrichomonas foetus]|eukprot:OHS94821.1 CAMK family protein kinase [Tritrichomonas foetus]